MTINKQCTPLEHVGQRIKMYRRRQHMTIVTLSEKVNISPSTISKYENAKLSINIDTLFEIANALNVYVNQLMDFQQPIKEAYPKKNETDFFQCSNIYYMYQYFGLDKKIYVCVMEIDDAQEEGGKTVTIYYDVKDVKNYRDAEYIYKGTMLYHNLITNIYCKNLYNDCDELWICAKSTFSLHTTTTGLLTAVSQSLRNPYSIKVIFSLEPLPLNDMLKNSLNICEKNYISELKRINALIIY